MPNQLHYVGSLDELDQQLIGYNYKEPFDSVQQLLGYLTKQDLAQDFNLVYNYEQKDWSV